MRPDRIELDLEPIATIDELFDLLQRELKFPGYFGRNWNAVSDCLCSDEQSLMPRRLVLKGWSHIETRLPEDAQIMREVLVEFLQERPECTVEWA